MSSVNRIIEIARSYLGKLELKGNSGFGDTVFEQQMKNVGWYKGAPWCAFFTKLVYKEAYGGHQSFKSIVNSCCSGGALQTLHNHENNGTFPVGETPKPGAIVIWRMGRGTTGHAGIVINVDHAKNTMTTIEGNTNASGSREGDRVAQKLRTITRNFNEKGLNVAGYIYAVDI